MATTYNTHSWWGSAMKRSTYIRAHAGFAALAVLLSVVLGVALRVRSIWEPRLWNDEVFNYSLSNASLINLMKGAAVDMGMPPLFYLLLKPWILFVGPSLAGLRLLISAFAAFAFVPFIFLGRALGLRTREMALACALMAVNGYLLVYSYYLRPYSLLFFLTLCSHLCFINFLKRDRLDHRRSLLILITVNILLVNTHYFGWLTFAAQYLWILFARRSHLRAMTTAALCVLLSFMPWVSLLVYTASLGPYSFLSQVTWETRPNLQTILLLLRSFNGGFENAWLTLAGSTAFLLLIGLAIRYSGRGRFLASRQAGHKEDTPLMLLAWLAAFPVVFSLAVAYALSWCWGPRYVIGSIGPYLLLIGACAFRLPTRPMQILAVSFLLVWSVTGAFAGDLPEALHGPNGRSYMLALALSHAETNSQGPIPIYGLSPYAVEGLDLAFSITGEHRFRTIPYRADGPLPDSYFWIALVAHDKRAVRRVKELSSDPAYVLGDPLISGELSRAHIAVLVQQSH